MALMGISLTLAWNAPLFPFHFKFCFRSRLPHTHTKPAASSWFVAPHLTFPAPFWVIPGCTSWINFLRNRSIKSLFRPLVVSHCPTNKVMTSHPGIQSPLKSDFCRLPRPSPRDSAPSLTFSTLCHFHSSHVSTFVHTLSSPGKSSSPSHQQSFCQNLTHPLWHSSFCSFSNLPSLVFTNRGTIL